MEYKPLKFVSSSERADYLYKICKSILGEKAVSELILRGFCTAPASTRYHGAYAGGLFDHSMNVANQLMLLTAQNKLDWKKATSPLKVGILHDLCKIDQYKFNVESGRYEYNNDILVKGHGIKSVVYTYSLLGIELTDEEEACILYHMGAFTEKDEWRDYTEAVHRFPNVLWTHQADMIASHIMEV